MSITLFCLSFLFVCDNLLLQKRAQSLCEMTVFLCVNLIDPNNNNNTNHQHGNHSFDNLSEIGYSQYAKKMDKSQQRQQLEASRHRVPSFVASPLPPQPIASLYSNQTRLSRNQQPLNSVHSTYGPQLAPRSSSSTNDQR